MRRVRATAAAHTRGASTAAPMRCVLTTTTTHTSTAGTMRDVLAATTADTLAAVTATMRDVLTTTTTDTLAGIAGAPMRGVLATVHCTLTLAKTSATAAGINNPLATAAAEIQPLLAAAAVAKPVARHELRGSSSSLCYCRHPIGLS